MSVVRPPKPYAAFPLFPHANGSWKRKIAGGQVSFGPWRLPNDPDAYERSWREALSNFLRYEEALASGRIATANPRGITVTALANAYLSRKHDDAEKGKIKHRTFAEVRAVCTGFRDAVGGTASVGDLERDPAAVRAFLANLDRRHGFHAYNRLVQYLACMWKWAADPNEGLLDGRAFRWHGLLKKKPIREFRRQRRVDREAGVLESFDGAEMVALLRHAHGNLLPMVLLGYFAGYGNMDLGCLPRNVTITVFREDRTINVQGRPETIPAGWGTIHYPRPKTELDRYALLPAEVVAALAKITRPPKVGPAARNSMFVTTGGLRVCYDVTAYDDAGQILTVSTVDSVKALFARLIERLGKCPTHGWVMRKKFQRARVLLCPECSATMAPMQRRGFYCLRHTATTIAAGSGASSDARNLFEGHSAGGGVRQTFYLDPTKQHDLLLIARALDNELTRNGGWRPPASASEPTAPPLPDPPAPPPRDFR